MRRSRRTGSRWTGSEQALGRAGACFKKKTITAVAVVAMLGISVQLLSGCEKEEAISDGSVHVGVTYYNQSDTFLNEMLTSFREQLKLAAGEENETTVTVLDAAGSQRTQDDQVKELIDMGCDVLCVNLVDRADPSEIIDMARDRDVPIIFFNREPVAEDLMQWDQLYYIGAQAKQSGILQGEMAAEVIVNNEKIDRNGDGKIQYVVLEGEAGHQDAIIRTGYAVDTLKSKGIELEKLSYQIANWNRAQAQNRMEQLISQYQNQIELVLANNDDMALGAIDAYKGANYTENTWPVFFGIDGTDVGLQAFLKGELAGTVYNDKEGQAEAMAKLAVAAGKGESFSEKYIYIDYRKVTKENVKEYLKK